MLKIVKFFKSALDIKYCILSFRDKYQLERFKKNYLELLIFQENSIWQSSVPMFQNHYLQVEEKSEELDKASCLRVGGESQQSQGINF